VKLTQNFRSHPAILKFPNKRFYRGQLQYKADPVITNSLFNAPSLATRGFPIVFHAILGKDMRKAGSPSFFNLDEASLVKAYIQELKDDKRSRLSKSYPQ
jgi:helicase MOV-10